MTLRFGVLGAARIVPNALVKPARAVDGVEVTAVAARDRTRAATFASKHRIPRVHESYEDVIADPDLDAVYVPLPNALHGRWTIAALEAGKHVLCEKPFTANAEEAERVAAVAATTDRVVMDAFHWRYHPLAQRMIDIVASGELGEVRHIDTRMSFPNVKRGDIRWDLGLAGGALMDECYTIHWARHVLGAEPEVRAARARLRAPGVDRWMQVDLEFPGGATGRATASMWSRSVLNLSLKVEGSAGTMRVLNPIAPQFGHLLTVRTAGGGRRRERVPGEATYTCQLRAFLAAVRGEASANLTPPSDSVATMRVLDAAYRAAGLPLRSGWA